MRDLFRPEAIEFRNKRYLGEVALSAPLASSIIWLLLCGLFLVGVSFAAWGQTTRVEKVRGWLRPEGTLLRLHSQGDWMINELFVEQGDEIKKGQPVFRAGEFLGAQGDPGLRDRSLSGMAAEERNLRDQLHSLDDTLQASQARLKTQIQLSHAEAAKGRESIQLQKNRIALLEQSMQTMRSLVDRGYVSKLEWQERHEHLIEAKQHLAELEKRQAAHAAQHAALVAQQTEVASASVQQRAQVSNALVAVMNRRRRFLTSQDFAIVAPIDGIVADLQVREGERSSAGQFLVAILPPRSQLISELFVPSRSAGHLKPGQQVHVHFDAYPSRLYGSTPGKITQIAATPIESREAPPAIRLAEPAYRILVALDRPGPGRGRNLLLRPGMTLSAEIAIDRHPIWKAFLGSRNRGVVD